MAVEAANHLKERSCQIDGEVVACDESGLAVFDLLRHGPSRKTFATLIAFTCSSSTAPTYAASRPRCERRHWPARAQQSTGGWGTLRTRERLDCPLRAVPLRWPDQPIGGDRANPRVRPRTRTNRGRLRSDARRNQAFGPRWLLTRVPPIVEGFLFHVSKPVPEAVACYGTEQGYPRAHCDNELPRQPAHIHSKGSRKFDD